jgi:hypothetical protein
VSGTGEVADTGEVAEINNLGEQDDPDQTERR